MKPKEDVSGMCHIGHGHLIEYGKGCDEVSKERIKEIDGLESIDDTITEDEAQEILEQDIDNHEQAAKKHLSDKTKLTQNQYDALVSFTYNTGGPDYEASGVPDLINSGSSNQVVQEKIKNFQNEDVGDRRKNEAKEFSC